ncbi:zinc finger CCCH domain-containing protein 15 homolog [Tachypleus tridentatus]|uniref:zinc finger CCCH domain-containing protein 15 homolog n=1 Tax=Tachypleus tridentatus TaxID=6853 RepID=UPI003FD262F6
MTMDKKIIAEKKKKAQVEQDRKKAEFKAGHHIGLSGREMFTFNPDLAVEGQMGESSNSSVNERCLHSTQTWL